MADTPFDGNPNALTMSRRDSLLLMVDVQERLAPAMCDHDSLIRHCSILLSAASEISVPVICSEQYPQGLGPTVAELAGHAYAPTPLAKVDFSCMRHAPISQAINGSGRKTIIIAGIEAHVCVLQTALDLLAAGYRVFVVADAVASRKADSKSFALQRLGAAGAVIATTEMVVFEWVGTAADPAFRTLSKLIR